MKRFWVVYRFDSKMARLGLPKIPHGVFKDKGQARREARRLNQTSPLHRATYYTVGRPERGMGRERRHLSTIPRRSR